MKNKIYVEMHAFNAEDTIERAIDSILNQTYRNLELHVLDNASTDGTLEIIKRYAKEDNRVVAYHFPENHTVKWMNMVIRMLFTRLYREPAWYASLSADDELDVTCFEKLMNFALENDLDIAACRSQFTGDVHGRVYNKNVGITENLIVEEKDFGEKFPEYWRYFRANWGHITKIPYESEMGSADERVNVEYGGDNRFMLAMMNHANKMGVLNETLHTYYIHENALSMSYTSNRHKASYGLFANILDYFEKKVGYLSDRNEEFLFRQIYLRHLMNAFPIVCDAMIPTEKKLEELRFMLTNDVTRQMLGKSFIPKEEKEECLKYAAEFMKVNGAAFEEFETIWDEILHVLKGVFHE
ncbi:MAG: glycosyltransferase family 2 protein [Lachnospiraceae bacterium]|nr:glycosyltransferase family 2 protein [Lachnospiraceae bacterium]